MNAEGFCSADSSGSLDGTIVLEEITEVITSDLSANEEGAFLNKNVPPAAIPATIAAATMMRGNWRR